MALRLSRSIPTRPPKPCHGAWAVVDRVELSGTDKHPLLAGQVRRGRGKETQCHCDPERRWTVSDDIDAMAVAVPDCGVVEPTAATRGTGQSRAPQADINPNSRREPTKFAGLIAEESAVSTAPHGRLNKQGATADESMHDQRCGAQER
jgi:hypothetical protein